MATLVAVTIGPVGCTYRSLYEFEALNLNLVGLDQYYEVTLEDECWHPGGVDFNGWTTDATRYIHLKGKNGPANHKPRLSEHGYGMATICNVNGNYGTAVITVNNIGVNGYIIFENLCFYSLLGNGTHVILCQQGSAVTLDFRRCLLQGGTDASTNDNGVGITGHNNNVVKMHNCIINVGGQGIGQSVIGTIHLYNCTVYARGGFGGLQCANNAASVIKNCYVHGGGAWGCLYEKTGVTLIAVATSDATGSVGLQNIACSHVNFKSIAKTYGSRELMAGSALIGSGTSIVGQPAPFDYTTDFLGKTIVAANPDIGALMHDATESPVVIERHLKDINTWGDYDTMFALEAANRDLVVNNEQWTIHCDSFTDAGANVDFNGWNTDPIHYLHIKGRDLEGTVRQEAPGGTILDPVGCYNLATNTTILSARLTFTDFGANGLIILEGIACKYVNSWFVLGVRTVSFAQASGTVRMVRCRINSVNDNARALQTEVGSGGTVELFNCAATAKSNWHPGSVLNCSGGTLVKCYHCTFATRDPGGADSVVNMGNVAGSELVNCYSAVWVGSAAKAYDGLVGVTMTTCGSSDLTGTAGLQSIAYDAVNFHDTATWLIPNLRIGSALLGVGTDLSGYAPPYNISIDIDGCTRPAAPSIGCCDLPDPICLGWHVKDGIPILNTRAITHTAVHPTSDALYLGANTQGGKPGEIYSLANVAAAYNLEYSHPWFGIGTDASCTGIVAHLGSMYAVMGSHAPVAKEGAPWTEIAALYLGGSVGSPTGARGLVSGSDGLMHCRCLAGGGWTVYKDADGVGPWSTEAGFIRGQYALSGFGSYLWEHPDVANEYYSSGGYGILMSIRGGVSGEMCIFPDTVDGNYSKMMHDSTYVYLLMYHNVRMGLYRALRTDMKFKKIASLPNMIAGNYGMAVANGQIYLYGPSAGANRAFFYSTDQGENWSLSSVPETTAGGTIWIDQSVQKSIVWQGRIVFGTWANGVVTNGIWYSDEFVNAVQFDNFSANQAQWNQGKYSSTALVKAVSPTDHPYVRLTMSPKDNSGPLAMTTTRRVRNYYTIPPYFRWMQYRLSLDLTTNYQRYREDGFRWYERVYKDAQDVYLQAPCCTAGLVPVSFVHPLEPKTAERMSFYDVGNLNSLFLKFRWVPTFANTSIEADQEFVRIGYDGLNYVSVTMLGEESKEREWDINDRYGLHEPRFSIKRVRAGALEWTERLVVYYSYPGGTPGADRLLDDAMEFEIVQKSGEVWGLTVRTAGITGQVMHSANTTPFAASGPTTLTYTGWGYFTAPVVLNTVSTEPLDNRGPGRTMLSGRSGVLRRMSAPDQNTILIGDRDPTSGNISTLGDNPYLQPDSFNRADNPDLGSKWSTDIRTGAGWYINSNTAKCSGTGVERYVCLPRHTQIAVGLGGVKMNDNGVKIGILARYEYDPGVISRGITAYYVYLSQVGPVNANLIVSRIYKGVEEILDTEPLVTYTAGASCMLALYIHDTTRLYATATVGVTTVTADYTDTAAPVVLTKPGRLGLYAITGGPAEIVETDVFTVIPAFTTGVL
jgi:hypothetical protein